MYAKIKSKIFKPENLKEYFSLIKNLKNYKPVAGGTDLIVKIKTENIQFENLIIISHIKELKGIYEKNDYIFIGAGNTFSELIENPLIKKYTSLYKAIKSIGSPQIRNVATIGGNIVNASPSADSVPALLLYDAELLISDGKKEYCKKLSEFFISAYNTILKENELIIGVKIKNLNEKKSDFFKIGHRKALAISRINLAYSVLNDNSWRISLGAVTPFPIRLTSCEELFNSGIINKEKIKKSLENDIYKYSKPRKSYEYKLPVIEELLEKIYNIWN